MEPRILVADDEKEILNILADFMEEFGYRADFADTVDGALVLMQKMIMIFSWPIRICLIAITIKKGA